MPDVVNGYCTTDNLREQLGDLGSQNLSETMLVRAINAASRSVDNYTDRRFWADAAPVAKTFEVPAGCGNELWLPEDIAYSAGLQIATSDGTVYGTPWDAADYRLWPYRANTSGSTYGGWWKIESTRGLRFDVHGTNGILPVQITGRFGWSFCPAEVEQATILKAAHVFKRKDAPYGVAQFGDLAAVQITRRDYDVIELLWPYVRDVAMVA